MQCSTPGCGATPFSIKPKQALAMVEHELATNPEARFRLPCDACGRVTSYSREAILGIIPQRERARPLPTGQAWAYLLAEVQTTFEDRAFFGERILVEVAARSAGGSWSGRTLTASTLSDLLCAGTYVIGETSSGFMLVDAVNAGSEVFRVTDVELRHGVNAALFFAPKAPGPLSLRCESFLCANPSCSTVFVTTPDEVRSMTSRAARSAPDTVAHFSASLECEQCGTYLVVTDRVAVRDAPAASRTDEKARPSERASERGAPTMSSGMAFLPVLGDCAEAAAELFERAISGTAADEPCVARDGLYVDSIFVVLHLVDRLSLARFGVGGRMLFMDGLLATMSQQGGMAEDVLGERFNTAQEQFGACRRLFAAADEPLAGTLYWEIGKDLARRHDIADPATVMVLAATASSVGALVERAYDAAEPRAF